MAAGSDQRLECPVCLNTFRDPRILSCSHTFCKACLDNLLKCHDNDQTLRCPVCRADTQVPYQDVSKLQANLAVKYLIENVEKQYQGCTNCKSQEQPKAVVYCQDCGRYLCIVCQNKHSQWEGFSDHVVLAMDDIASGKVAKRRYRKCRKHSKEDEECFCCDCRRFACFRCVVMEHKEEGHRITEASVYENNHWKRSEDLKCKADMKHLCFQKYIDFIENQKDHVSNARKQCIDDINKAYEEAVQQLTESKTRLIGKVMGRTEGVEKELNKMKKSAQQQIAHLTAITDLVTSGTKIPLEMDALAAHDTLCEELQEALKQDDPDYKQLRKCSKKGKCVAFERNMGRDELGLGKIVDSVGKNIALPTKDSMNVMVPTPDGRMAVGCRRGGVHIFSTDGQLQKTVLKNVKIRKVGFQSEGRYVIRDTRNNITLYTSECEKLDVRFETLNYEQGGSGGLSVDSNDQIFVSYRKAKKIQVFSPSGGKAIREIPCNGYEPMQIVSFCPEILVTNSKRDSVSVVDSQGVVKYKLKDPRGNYLHATVSQDNSILIARVKEGLVWMVSINEYTKEVKHVKTLISDYKIKRPGRNWFNLQQYQSGEVAFCTPDRLYIFH